MKHNISRLVIKITISVVLIGLTVLSFVLVSNYNEPKEVEIDEIEESNSNVSLDNNPVNDSYNITIVLFDYEKEISNKSINIKKEDALEKGALFNILNDNYKIRYETTIYGVLLLDIDSIKTDFKSSYIAIYIDDKYSSYGISSIKLYDGMKISFKETRIWQ